MFQFKQFIIHQDKCAQKVSELACIQGAWTAIPRQAKRVLDIGSGTGLLSLMLAQRFEGVIDAIEIDEDAYQQGKENIMWSPFHQRINVWQGDIRVFKFLNKYDFIISNPPFFEKQLKGENEKTNTAKHSSQLTLIELLSIIDKLLEEQGQFSILFPYDRKDELERSSAVYNFYLSSYLILRHSIKHKPKAFIGIFSRSIQETKTEEFIIKENGIYSDKMKKLIEEYYL